MAIKGKMAIVSTLDISTPCLYNINIKLEAMKVASARMFNYRSVQAGLVAIAGGNAPDPFPNSAVKTPSADGTAS